MFGWLVKKGFILFLSWKISTDKFFGIVTENGANIVKALKLLKERVEQNASDHGREDTEMDNEVDDEEAADEGDEMDMSLPSEVPCRRMPCLAHSLQLVIKDVYRSDEYSQVLGKNKT